MFPDYYMHSDGSSGLKSTHYCVIYFKWFGPRIIIIVLKSFITLTQCSLVLETATDIFMYVVAEKHFMKTFSNV